MLATLEESSNLRQAEQDRERDLVVSSSPIAKKMRATLEESSNPHQAEQDRELDLVVSSSPIANALLPRSAISSPRALAQSVTRQAMSRSSEASTSSLSVLRRPLELSSYERSRTTPVPASSSSCVDASRPDESDDSFDSSFDSDTDDSIEIEEDYDDVEDEEEYEEESDEEEEYSEY